MSDKYEQFEKFRSTLREATTASGLALESDSSFTVYYVPFEYINPKARLVLVGITPGPEQMKCAYASARRLLTSKMLSDTEILREIKRCCAFVGMRPRINEMLDHFGIPRSIGGASASALWERDFALLQTASIVPNAAFRNGAYFNGPFSDVLKSNVLRKQFEGIFIPSIQRIGAQAVYLGMGPVVDEALKWCAERGALRSEQILGYFPHASGNSGSQFGYFMRRKRLCDLKPLDPVRHRVRDLDAAYERIATRVKAMVSPNAENTT